MGPGHSRPLQTTGCSRRPSEALRAFPSAVSSEVVALWELGGTPSHLENCV